MAKAIILLCGSYPYEKAVKAIFNDRVENNLIAENVFEELSETVKEAFNQTGEITWGIFGKREAPCNRRFDTINIKMIISKDIKTAVVLGRQFLNDKRGVRFQIGRAHV